MRSTIALLLALLQGCSLLVGVGVPGSIASPGLYTTVAASTGVDGVIESAVRAETTSFSSAGNISFSDDADLQPARVEESGEALSFIGKWSLIKGGDSGGQSAYLNSTGSVTFSFTGSSVKWLSRVTSNAGIARVSLDGVFMGEVDRYAPSAGYQRVVFSREGLAPGPHELKIEWTGKRRAESGGSNLVIDAFDYLATVDRPTNVTVVPLTDGYGVSWAPVAVAGVTGYELVRTDASGSSASYLVAPNQYSYRDDRATLGAPYTYTVIPRGSKQLRLTSAASAPVPTPEGDLVRALASSAECPGATVTVSSATELRAALDVAQSGTVIHLTPGTYTGQFKLRNVAGGSDGIWICGPRTAVLTTGSTATGSALMLTSVSEVTVRGITLQNSLKGVSVISSTNVVLRDLTVSDIGYEAIHFRTQTTDSMLAGSTIQNIGTLAAKYGEGVYVGTSSANTCEQNGCEPDRTDRIAVVDNVIRRTGAQGVEAKEGTSGGVIIGNTISGDVDSDPASTGLILVKGDNWDTVMNNVTVTGGYGLANIFAPSGGGEGNLFAGNRISGPATQGIWVHQPSWTVVMPRVLCSNMMADGGASLSNQTCGP